ncbi:MAG: hypothetical protein WCL28_05165 [bacterium]
MIQSPLEPSKSRQRGRSRPSLKELADLYPAVWQEVVAGLKERVAGNQGEALVAWRQAALAELESAPGKTADWQVEQSESVIKAQMTLLAIEQFADVMTGKVAAQPRLGDKIRFKFFLLPKIIRGSLFSLANFDRRWRALSDPMWAAGELQRSGVWSVPTLEFVQKIMELCAGRKVLELGAGLGVLFAGLKSLGVNISAVDDDSWQISGWGRGVDNIQKMDASLALKTVSPEVVICSWPPPGNQFEVDVFKTKSVQMYIAVLSKQPFASGNWAAYKNQNQFDCTTMPALNALLRPIEAEQQVFVFRRK